MVMKEFVKIVLKSGKDEAVRRFHPWVFSGAIKKMYGEPQEGDVVEVFSNHDDYLGTGHYQVGSIAVRIFSFQKVDPAEDFWRSKLLSAYQYRKELGLVDSSVTDAYRLVHAEGDGLPGLIIDFYNGTAVMQMHSIGMYLVRDQLANALKDIYGEKLTAVYDKSGETLPKMAKLDQKDGYLFGSPSSDMITEYGNQFVVDWENGQKTGFFLDQRENRKLLERFSSGKKVLNTFCYTGGFSVYALKAGAADVHSIDSSKKAVELTEKNIALNNIAAGTHQSFQADAIDFLKDIEDKYDVIILDPPAFAKHHDARQHAIQGYKRINLNAIKQIRKGGFLFTFSCSQIIDRSLFNSTVISAAILSGRNVRIIHQLTQPPDHPVNAFHPEGEYLKGLVLYIE
jgi:23S rRNA (cytosine1962-C5)-methyltransferase